MKLSQTFILICINCGVFFAQDIYSQVSETFSRIDRKVIFTETSQVDIKKYSLASVRDDIALISTYNLPSHGYIDCNIITHQGVLKSSLKFQLKKKHQKKIIKLRLQKVTFSNDSVFILFSDYLLVGNLKSTTGIIGVELFELKSTYDNMEFLRGMLFLYNCGKHYSSRIEEATIYISKFSFSDNIDYRIAEFQPDDHFLLNFQSRNLFAFSENSIFYLHPDKPLISELNFDGVHKQDISYKIDWTKVSDSERNILNDLSNRNPQLLFSKVGDRILNGKLSMNIRIDRISDDFFSVTLDPGLQKDSVENVRFKFDIWELSHKGFIKVGSLKAPLDQHYIRGLDGMIKFGFHAYDGNTYFYKSGKRYQINIEPHIEPSASSVKEIEQFKQQSILANKFDLCLYIGTLNLP